MRPAFEVRSNAHKCAGTAHKRYSPFFSLVPKCPSGGEYLASAYSKRLLQLAKMLLAIAHKHSVGLIQKHVFVTT
jgi:hypothetical protein